MNSGTGTDKRVEFEYNLGDDYSILLCPNCGDTYLHHGHTVVINREDEDGDGVAVDVKHLTTVVFPMKDDDIPGRRDWTGIRFFCEGCQSLPVLHIMQHKGQTLVSWGQLGAIVKEDGWGTGDSHLPELWKRLPKSK